MSRPTTAPSLHVEQRLAGVQDAGAAGHPPPAVAGLGGVGRLAQRLAVELQQRVGADDQGVGLLLGDRRRPWPRRAGRPARRPAARCTADSSTSLTTTSGDSRPGAAGRAGPGRPRRAPDGGRVLTRTAPRRASRRGPGCSGRRCAVGRRRPTRRPASGRRRDRRCDSAATTTVSAASSSARGLALDDAEQWAGARALTAGCSRASSAAGSGACWPAPAAPWSPARGCATAGSPRRRTRGRRRCRGWRGCPRTRRSARRGGRRGRRRRRAPCGTGCRPRPARPTTAICALGQARLTSAPRCLEPMTS